MTFAIATGTQEQAAPTPRPYDGQVTFRGFGERADRKHRQIIAQIECCETTEEVDATLIEEDLILDALRLDYPEYHEAVSQAADDHKAILSCGASTPLTGRYEINAETGCWMWTSFINEDGYGRTTQDGKLKYAHRISYEIHRGEIPDGMCVCHSCDTPACVNPDHLWLGSRSDNNADRDEKGRHAPHSKGGNFSISDTDVENIKNASGTVRAIAAEFNVSPGYVSQVKNGKRRSGVDGNLANQAGSGAPEIAQTSEPKTKENTMFQIDTGNEGGTLGPWMNWTSNGSAMKGLAPKTWVLRGKDENDEKVEHAVPAFENGCVMDLDTLQLGWMKDGGAGQAPEKRWNPTVSQATPRPDESKKPGGGYAWSPGLSVRCAIGGGQAATWEQASFGAYDAFSKLAKQISAEWGTKSQNGRLLPLVKQTGVEKQVLKSGPTNKPILQVVDWVERPDCLKADAPAIATSTPAPQPEPTPAPAPQGNPAAVSAAGGF